MQQLSRRAFLSLAAGTTAVAALAACQPAIPGAQPGGAAPAAADVARLNLWGFTGPIWEAMISAFNEQHDNINVNLTEIGDTVFGDQKFLTAVAANTGPDAAIQNRHTFLQFAAKGLYQDVTPWFEQGGLERADFTPVQFEESSWNGNIFGLPLFTDVRYLYWNKEHYEEAGLDPDTPPTT